MFWRNVAHERSYANGGHGDDERTFDVLVDGRRIATETLRKEKPDEFFTREYSIPMDLVQDKSKVTVRFQAPADSIAGGLYGCAVYKRKQEQDAPSPVPRPNPHATSQAEEE